MEDKTYQQALDEIQDRMTAEFQEEIHKRLRTMDRHTIESITQNIPDQKMRKIVTNLLVMLKLAGYLAYPGSIEGVSQAECDELNSWILKLVNAQPTE